MRTFTRFLAKSRFYSKSLNRIFPISNVEKVSFIRRFNTPFLNRTDSLAAMTYYSANFAVEIELAAQNGEKVHNWGYCSFCFSAHMMGAGKSRFAKEFPNQLNLCIENSSEANFTLKDVEKLCDRQSEKKYIIRMIPKLKNPKVISIDLGGTSTFERALTKLTDEIFRHMKWENPKNFTYNEKNVINLILEASRELKQPIYIYFDEISNLSSNELRDLRDFALEVYREISGKASLQNGLKDMHVPMFLFVGRGSAFGEIGTVGSRIKSHWLMLEPLPPKHIEHIVNETTDSDGSVGFPLVKSLPHIAKQSVVNTVSEWTCGSPRPILYFLSFFERALEAKYDTFESEESCEEFLMELWRKFKTTGLFEEELGIEIPRDEKLRKKFLKAYYELWIGTSANKKWQFTDKIIGEKLQTYLRQFHVSMSQRENRRFEVFIPKVVQFQIIEEMGVLSYVNDKLTPGTDYPKFFEFVVRLTILKRQSLNLGEKSLSKLLFPLLENSSIDHKISKVRQFSAVLPKVTKDGRLGEKDFEDIKSGKYWGNLSSGVLGKLIGELEPGTLAHPKDRSASADCFLVVNKKAVMELQIKSGQQKVTLSSLSEELAKSCVHSGYSGEVVFVLLSTSPEREWEGDLVLEAGQSYRVSGGRVEACAEGTLRTPKGVTCVVPSLESVEKFLGHVVVEKFQKVESD